MNVIFLTVLFLGELGLKIAVAKFGFVENLVARGLLYVYVGSMSLVVDEERFDCASSVLCTCFHLVLVSLRREPAVSQIHSRIICFGDISVTLVCAPCAPFIRAFDNGIDSLKRFRWMGNAAV